MKIFASTEACNSPRAVTSLLTGAFRAAGTARPEVTEGQKMDSLYQWDVSVPAGFNRRAFLQFLANRVKNAKTVDQNAVLLTHDRFDYVYITYPSVLAADREYRVIRPNF
jgi:hypothetical protein